MKLCTFLAAVCLFVVANNLPAQSPTDTSTPPVAASGVDPAIINELQGSWKNQLGSTLAIKQIDVTTGQITGTYKSPSGTSGQEFPVLGWVIHSAPAGKDNVVVVSFSVRWGPYGSVTSWNGSYKLVDGKPVILGQWLLVRSNSDFAWDHTLTGLDTFTPLK